MVGLRELSMYQLLLVVLVVACNGQTDQQVVSEDCFNNLPLGNNLCVKVTSRDCFQLTGTVTLNGQQLFSENIPVGTLLSLYQTQVRISPTVCRTLGMGNFQCNLCSTARELSLSGDNLHYCGSMSLNCTTPFNPVPITQTITPNCVDIRNCAIYGCRNNCSKAGTCSSIGMCQCNPGHYGLDCSLTVTENCVQSNQFDRTCWDADFPDCNTIDFKVTSTRRGQLVHQRDVIRGGSLQLLPCTQLPDNLRCEVCVNVVDLTVVNDEMIGCPAVRLNCRDTPVNDYKTQCITMAKSSKLVCPSAPNTVVSVSNSSLTGIFSSTSTGKLVLMSFVGILVLIGLGATVFFVYSRCNEKNANPYMYDDGTAGGGLFHSDEEVPFRPATVADNNSADYDD